MYRLVVLCFTLFAVAVVRPSPIYTHLPPAAISHQSRLDIIESKPLVYHVLTVPDVHHFLENAEDEVHHLEDVVVEGHHLEDAVVEGDHLEDVVVEGHHLEDAVLEGDHLEDVVVEGHHLEDAIAEGHDVPVFLSVDEDLPEEVESHHSHNIVHPVPILLSHEHEAEFDVLSSSSLIHL